MLTERLERDGPGQDRGPIAETVVFAARQVAGETQFVAGTEIQRKRHVPVPRPRPLAEIVVPPGKDAGKGIDLLELRGLDRPAEVEIGQLVGPDEVHGIHGSAEVAFYRVGRVQVRVVLEGLVEEGEPQSPPAA